MTISSRSVRRERRLSLQLFWLVLIVTVLQGLFWGWIVPSQRNGSFPIFVVAGFRLRIDESLIVVGFVLLVAQYIIRALTVPIRRPRLRTASLLLLWATAGILVAAVRGYMNQIPNSLMEVRSTVVPLMFFVIAVAALKHIPLTSLAKNLYRLLLPLAIVLTLGSFLPVAEWLNRNYERIGLRYGGMGNGPEAILIFFLTLVMARHILQPTKSQSGRAWELILILFLVAGFVVRVSKPGWANAAAVISFTVVLTLLTHRFPRAPGLHRLIAHRWARFALASTVIVAAGIFITWATIPDTANGYVDRAIARIMRSDIGGDISGGRIELMQEGHAVFLHAPIVGRGMGMWYVPPQGSATQPVAAESDAYIPDHFAILWFLVRGGLFTFVPILLLVIWHVRRGFGVARYAATYPGGYLVFACFVFTLVIIFFSFFGVPQSFLEAMILFWLSVAVVHSPRYCQTGIAVASNLNAMTCRPVGTIGVANELTRESTRPQTQIAQ